ncbi:TolC family protein [Deminuibacter soli]|uniref:TolC family protein n=2 Tax=Deminuibacter soli TaxID=2291815 RepID=A0A3E1NJU6_9BACT|nr:TolC family protein [Deminuibacter soli]
MQYIPCVAFAAAAAGCSTYAPVAQNTPKLRVPEQFATAADTGSMAALPWQRFFTDSSLRALIDTALHNNPDLLSAVQHMQEAQANVLQSRAALLPVVNATVSAGLDHYGKYTMNGVGNDDTNLSQNVKGKRKIPDPTPDLFVGLRSSWEADLWGKLQQRKKAAVARYLATGMGRHLLVTELVAAVASLYYQLVALDREQAIVQENITLQANALELVKVQKLGGRATELAVQQFNAQLLNTQAIAYEKKQQAIALENELNNLLGRFALPVLRSKDFAGMGDSAAAGIPAALLQRRPDIQQAAFELEASKADVQAARAAFFPSLVLSPYTGFNAFRASVLFNGASLAYGVLGSVTAPILNRRELKANFSVADARQQVAFQQYRKTAVQAYNEVLTQLEQIRNAGEIARLKQQELEQLTNGVATAKDLYMAGYANYLEVITTQKNLLDASLESIEVQRRKTVATINLYKALGGGWDWP